MFASNAPSPLDLHFRLFGIPVRVQPWFWIVMAFLGSSTLDRGPIYLALWVGCGFFSILVHELGHALAYRAFSGWAMITLVPFGGITQANIEPRPAWRRLVVSAAGPLAGFALVAVVFGVDLLTGFSLRNSYTHAVVIFLLVQGIFWNLLNLLPIWPLDGGNIMRELFAMMRLRNGDILTHTISIGVAGFLALLGLLAFLQVDVPFLKDILFGYRPSLMMTVFLGMFAYQNYQILQTLQSQRRFYRDDNDDYGWRR